MSWNNSFFDFDDESSDTNRQVESEVDLRNDETFGDGSDWDEENKTPDPDDGIHHEVVPDPDIGICDEANRLSFRVASSILDDEEPSAEQHRGSRLLREASGTDPSALQHGDRLLGEASGTDPSAEQHGDRLMGEASGTEPSAEQHGDRLLGEVSGTIVTVKELEARIRGELALNENPPQYVDTTQEGNATYESRIARHSPNSFRPLLHRGRNPLSNRYPPRMMTGRFFPPNQRMPVPPPPYRGRGPTNPHHFGNRPFFVRPFQPNQPGQYQQQMDQRHPQGGFNLHTPGPYDEYAGLMHPQEKQWLTSIQKMQLAINQPHIDDYYYYMFNERQKKQEVWGRKTNNTNPMNTSAGSCSREPTKYVPQQFENSLGKLQAGSVTAPRKMIDMSQPDKVKSGINKECEDTLSDNKKVGTVTSVQKKRTDTVENVKTGLKHPDKKSKEILIEIEQLYSLLLAIEEGSNVNQQMSDSGSDYNMPDLKIIREKFMVDLLQKDKLSNIMAVKKGKNLILRFLPHVPNQEPLMKIILMSLIPIVKKDEEILLPLLPAVRHYLNSVQLCTIVEIMKHYDSEFLLSRKFTSSVLSNVMERAGNILDECHDKQAIDDWRLILIRLVRSTSSCVAPVRPVVAVNPELLYIQLHLIRGTVNDSQGDAFIKAISIK